MLPISASLSNQDSAATGSTPSAAVPIFSKTVVVGNDNDTRPNVTASATAANNDPQAVAGASQQFNIAPYYPVMIVGAGVLVLVVLLPILLPPRK